uniref:XK-related protein n=1 Tax=Ditylenchus dipsaci TaxID=166011 RepID=A0A915DPX0_9BILA
MKTEKLSLNKRLFGERRPKLHYNLASSSNNSAPYTAAPSALFVIPSIRISSPSTVSIENRLKQEPLEHIDGDKSKGTEEADRLPENLQVEVFDLLCYFFSIFTYLADILLDVLVAWMHYANKRYWSCIFISSLVVFPSLVLNIVAAIWWVDDEFANRKRRRKRPEANENAAEEKIEFLSQSSTQSQTKTLYLRLLMCFLQLGPILWYIEAIKSALRYREEQNKEVGKKDQSLALQHYCQMVEAERDASLLRFFESFMESVPQLLVQGFLVAQDFWRISLLAGLNNQQVVPNWVYVQMHRSLRVASPNKANMSYRDSTLQLYWHLFTLTSRYLCLVMFTLAFKEWILVVVALHYFISSFIYQLYKP